MDRLLLQYVRKTKNLDNSVTMLRIQMGGMVYRFGKSLFLDKDHAMHLFLIIPTLKLKGLHSRAILQSLLFSITLFPGKTERVGLSGKSWELLNGEISKLLTI